MKLGQHKDLWIRSQSRVWAYSEFGSYPLVYVVCDNMAYCSSCVTDAVKNGEDGKITAVEPNWEDPKLYCERCSERIESAYAEGEEEEGVN